MSLASLVGACSPLFASAFAGVAAVTQHLIPHASLPHSLPVVPGALIPLMLPGVAASVRRAVGNRYDEMLQGRESPAMLRRELHVLRAAYAELQADAAERRAATQRLNHLAHHDPLTNLPNRVLLMDRLTQALTFAKRAGSGVFIIYLDLDRFKSINDTLGHAAGDVVLSEVARRIANCMRGADTASRVGGDEFVLVCTTTDGDADVPQVANRILAAISAPINVFGTPVTIGASLGISLSPVDGWNATDLIAKADAAMYCAKQRGRNCFNLYTPQIQAGIERKLELEAELRDAIARDDFEVHYQPIVDVDSGNIVGAEALVRWRHPTRGLIAPAEFIGFAEEHGLAAEIGACVLRSVCAQLKRFSLSNGDEFAISVNVSADWFGQAGFVQSFAAEMAANATDPRRLCVEVAEKAIAGDVTGSTAKLRELTLLGIGLAIDDFGTGPSALADMKYLPVVDLKIDRSFIDGIVANPRDEAIAKTIVTLAHSLGMRVIAEGVETSEQAQKLRALGSDRLQGYLISRPLPAADFERFACTYGSLRLAA